MSRSSVAIAALFATAIGCGTPGDTISFTGVNLVTMTDSTVLVDRTVVVSAGRIVAIDSAGSPRGTVIDGRGRYLVPGLHDMYAHIDEASAPLFVAHGVTTVRNTMPGLPRHLALRDAIQSGEVTGPAIFTTGPPIAGSEPFYASVEPVSDPETARRIVREQHRAGYDGIAVYVDIEANTWPAVIDEAHRLGLPVSGHRPYKLPSESLMVAGHQDSKDNLLGEVDLRTGNTFVPEAALAGYAAATTASGIVTIPTLTIHRMRARRETGTELMALPEMAMVPRRQLLHWLNGEGGAYAVENYRYGGAPALVRTLHEAGSTILAGSDAGYPFLVAGLSMHDELANLVDAGLTPFEALAAATSNAAAFLRDSTRGTVAVGNRADLLLVNGNPLDDVRHLAAIEGVMLGGRWLPGNSLQALKQRPDERMEYPAGSRWPDDAVVAEYRILFRDESVGRARLARLERAAGTTWWGESVNAPHVPTWTMMELVLDPEGEVSSARLERLTERHRQLVMASRDSSSVLSLDARLGPAGDRSTQVPFAPGTLVTGPLLAVNLDTDIPLNLQLVIDHARNSATDSMTVVARRIELNFEEFEERALSGEVVYRISRSGDRSYRIAMPSLNGSVDHHCDVTLDDDGMLASASCGRIGFRRTLSGAADLPARH
ncbi:MAG TPA: amidohydrolase family protein [Gemmatimonadales bacterium]|nr:amidohydrolase family protein [Gemmatimonadales bacterium]